MVHPHAARSMQGCCYSLIMPSRRPASPPPPALALCPCPHPDDRGLPGARHRDRRALARPVRCTPRLQVACHLATVTVRITDTAGGVGSGRLAGPWPLSTEGLGQLLGVDELEQRVRRLPRRQDVHLRVGVRVDPGLGSGSGLGWASASTSLAFCRVAVGSSGATSPQAAPIRRGALMMSTLWPASG